MRIQDLIEQLQDLANEHGEDIEVRLAHQPQWAFEFSIGEVAVVEAEDSEDEGAVVYIGEGEQLGYLSGAGAVALGWKEERAAPRR